MADVKNYTPRNILSIMLQDAQRITKNTPPQPRFILGGYVNLTKIFGNASFATRKPTVHDELRELGFSAQQIQNFSDAWFLAWSVANVNVLKHVNVPEPVMGQWEYTIDSTRPHLHKFRRYLIENLEDLYNARPDAFIPGHADADMPVDWNNVLHPL